jgi:hypothetical protein
VKNLVDIPSSSADDLFFIVVFLFLTIIHDGHEGRLQKKLLRGRRRTVGGSFSLVALLRSV